MKLFRRCISEINFRKHMGRDSVRACFSKAPGEPEMHLRNQRGIFGFS